MVCCGCSADPQADLLRFLVVRLIAQALVAGGQVYHCLPLWRNDAKIEVIGRVG